MIGLGIGIPQRIRGRTLAAPVNTVAPVISGTETEGETLSVTNGTWLNSPSSYTYEWFRAITSGGSIVTSGGLFTGVQIAGETNATYDLTSADVGERIYAEVTATNASGSAMKQSNATGEIAAIPFTPADLFSSDAGAFYDPSDLSSMFQDSAGTTPAAVDSPVGRINDKSGNGNHATQATAGRRPILKESGGKYWLEFDGVDDAIRSAFAYTQPFNRVSAIRQIGWSLGARIISDDSVGLCLYQSDSSPEIILYNGAEISPSSQIAAIGTDVVVTERYNGASSTMAINNDAYGTPSGAGTDSGTAVTMGAALGDGALPSNVRIYGMVMIDRSLTAGEITDCRNYFAAKAGVTL